MLTVADLAWTAGIIDGEGSIFVMRQKRKDRERDTNFILRVSVQSTDPYMTKELLKMFPEGAEFSVQRERGLGWSDTLKWQLNGKKAARFIKEILPFLRVKQAQAALAIEFQETTKKHWRHMLPEDYEKQAYLYTALKQAKIDLKIGQEHNITKES
jgi:hypothetical protein